MKNKKKLFFLSLWAIELLYPRKAGYFLVSTQKWHFYKNKKQKRNSVNPQNLTLHAFSVMKYNKVSFIVIHFIKIKIPVKIP